MWIYPRCHAADATTDPVMAPCTSSWVVLPSSALGLGYNAADRLNRVVPTGSSEPLTFANVGNHRSVDQALPGAPAVEDSQDRSGRNGTWVGAITVLMTATQLRPPGGVGAFELLLTVFMVSTLPPRQWWGLRSLSSPPGRLLAAIAVVGALGGYYSSLVLVEDSVLDLAVTLIPFVYALICVEYVLGQTSPREFLVSWCKVFSVGILGAFLALFFIELAGLGGLTPFEIYVDGVRFKAWTNNPNQASAMIVLAVLAFARTHHTFWPRFVMVLVAGLVGFETASDGLRLSTAVALPVVIVLAIFLVGTKRSLSALRMRVAAIALCVLGLGAVVAFWPVLVDSASAVANDGGQGDERVDLWLSCWSETQRSPVFGLGTTPQGVNSFGKVNECHSSLFDIAVSAGIPVAIGYILMTAHLLVIQLRNRELWGVMFVIQITVMLLFNFFLRYPQLWFMFLFLYLDNDFASQRAKEQHEADATNSPELLTPSGVQRFAAHG